MGKVANIKPRLRVVSVQAKDVLGAREFNIEPGKITTLSGRNGSGKSSGLQAIQAALGGGNLCKLARVDEGGAETEPEVVLVIEADRGPESYRVERKGDKVRVRARVGETAAFEDVDRPQAWLTSLFDPRGANPVSFLTAKDKDRALMLLEALPLKLDRAELASILGDLVQHVTGAELLARLHPLEEIQGIRAALFNARTGVNRDQKSAAQAADQLKRSTPAVIPEAASQDDLAALEDERAALSGAIGAERTAIEKNHDALVEKAGDFAVAEEQRITGEFKRRAAQMRAEHAAKVAEMEKALEAAIAGLKDADEHRLDEIDAARDRTIAEAGTAQREALAQLEQRQAVLTELTASIAEKRAQADNASKARALAEQTKEFEENAERLKSEGDRLTLTIDELDSLARRLADSLPIAGLEIRDRDIFVNGIKFDQINTQAKVDIAVKVACLRAKDSRLAVLFVDGAEALDTAHFQALVNRLEQESIQAFLGRVEDHDFTVETKAEAVTV